MTGPLPDGLRSLGSSAAPLRGVYGFDGLQVMRESARQAAELENDPGSAWYTLARATLGFSLYLSGEFPAAAAALEEAVASPASRTLIGVLAFSVLSLVMLDTGQLPRAQELADTAIDLASHGELRDMPQCSLAYAAAGAVHAARGLLEEGRTELQHAVGCRRAVPKISPWATLEATLLLVRVELDLGEVAAAAEPSARRTTYSPCSRTGRDFSSSGWPGCGSGWLRCGPRIAQIPSPSASWPSCSCSRARCPSGRSPRSSMCR